MAVQAAPLNLNLPLTDAQIQSVLDHVPEEAFTSHLRRDLQDWRNQVPVISRLFDIDKPDVPAELHARLFFNEQFMNSKRETVNGIALMLFYELSQDSESAAPSLKWKMEYVAFQNKQCVGSYLYGGRRDGRSIIPMVEDASKADFSTHAKSIMGDGLNLIYHDLYSARTHALSAKPKTRAADELALNEQAGHLQLEPADERPWYQMITDAFCGCFWSLVDCFKRLLCMET